MCGSKIKYIFAGVCPLWHHPAGHAGQKEDGSRLDCITHGYMIYILHPNGIAQAPYGAANPKSSGGVFVVVWFKVWFPSWWSIAFQSLPQWDFTIKNHTLLLCLGDSSISIENVGGPREVLLQSTACAIQFGKRNCSLAFASEGRTELPSEHWPSILKRGKTQKDSFQCLPTLKSIFFATFKLWK